MNVEIRFGTDGWRGVIARDFTFDNVCMVAQAICDYLDEKKEDRRIAIGYDFRFLSEDFAKAVAEICAGNGVKSFLSAQACPTPHVSYFVRENKLPLGVVITASHNPYQWNGLKIKEPYGGSARPETTKGILECLGKSPVRSTPFREAKNGGLIAEIPLDEGYDRLIESLVDVAAIRRSSLRIVADSMNGVSGKLLEHWVASPTCRVRTLRSERDPLFGFRAPEPKEEFLDILKDAVLSDQADIGLATDGDGDRSGGVLPDGEIFTPLEMIALLAVYLIEKRNLKGTIAGNNANTLYLRRIAEHYSIPFENLPVGFKYIAELMQSRNIIIGGEESGGMTVQGFLPERDGVLINLLILEMMVKTGKPIAELLRDLYARFGEFHFKRRDFGLGPEVGRRQVAALAAAPPERLLERRVEGVDTLDGTKLLLSGGSWILFRQSGTEPTLRVYCEAPTRREADQLIMAGMRILGVPPARENA